MRRIAALALASGIVLSFAPGAYAAPAPVGATCGLATAWSSNAAPPYVYRGAIYGGPLTLRDNVNPAVVYSGTMTCTVQINQSTHAGTDVCAAPGPTTGIEVTVPPAPCAYNAGPSDTVYVCTHVDFIGSLPRLHWNGGSWSTSNTASCEFVSTVFCDSTTVVCGAKPLLLDPLLCPLFAPFFPPQGDIGIFWDCPPYGSAPPGTEFGVHVLQPSPAT